MILEMIKCHNMADVFYAAKTLRNYKPNMVETLVSISHRRHPSWLLVPVREERCWGMLTPAQKKTSFPSQILNNIMGILMQSMSRRACQHRAVGWGRQGGEAALGRSFGLAFISPCQRLLGGGVGLVGNPSQE